MGVFEKASEMQHEQVVYCHDRVTGLKAIVAIHDTTLGPALGGCRFWDYQSEEQALNDVLRLSRGMTYKAAVSGLNLGGGKAVIIGDPSRLKSEAFFKAFGRFIDSLGGRYITAEDVNIKVSDMEIVATETPYVTGISSREGSGDPSPVTAYGVYHGIRASVAHKLGKSSLRHIKVAVQGCGAVGSNLVKLLAKDGAEVHVADLDETKVRSLVESSGAVPCYLDRIHAQEVDVFAPCALGACLNDKTIPEIQAPIIAGGANNQLADESEHSKVLKEKNILYAPDYVINAGGLINVFQELKGYNRDLAIARTAGIHDTLLSIFQVATEKNCTTIEASNAIAEKRINEVKQLPRLRNRLDEQHWLKQRRYTH